MNFYSDSRPYPFTLSVSHRQPFKMVLNFVENAGYFLIGGIFGVLLGTLLNSSTKKGVSINEIIYTRDENIEFSSKLLKSIRLPKDSIDRNLAIFENCIKSSTRSVFVAMFAFTSHKLLNHLVEAKKRGVHVIVILSKECENSSSKSVQDSVIARMKREAIDVVIDQKCEMLHLKMCLIDIPHSNEILPKPPSPVGRPSNDRRRYRNRQRQNARPLMLPHSGIIITGSMNWSASGLKNNEENIIISSDHNICRPSMIRFEKLWKESTTLDP